MNTIENFLKKLHKEDILSNENAIILSTELLQMGGDNSKNCANYVQISCCAVNGGDCQNYNGVCGTATNGGTCVNHPAPPLTNYTTNCKC